jgi:hypothetical protein
VNNYSKEEIGELRMKRKKVIKSAIGGISLTHIDGRKGF